MVADINWLEDEMRKAGRRHNRQSYPSGAGAMDRCPSCGAVLPDDCEADELRTCEVCGYWEVISDAA